MYLTISRAKGEKQGLMRLTTSGTTNVHLPICSTQKNSLPKVPTSTYYPGTLTTKFYIIW
jgi:hypothetical protein